MNDFSIISTAILIFFILDPFGNIPLLLSLLKNIDKKRHFSIIVREVIIGLIILIIFLFFGESILNIFHLQTASITIAGGIIFFIISIKMIFPTENGNIFASAKDDEPLIVPIAMPMIAGPAALATILVLAKTNNQHISKLFISVILAWFISSLIMLFSTKLYNILKDRGLTALERLMGMLLLIMSVQMFVDGIRALIGTFCN